MGIRFLGSVQKRQIQGHNEIRGCQGPGRARGHSGGTRTLQNQMEVLVVLHREWAKCH